MKDKQVSQTEVCENQTEQLIKCSSLEGSDHFQMISVAQPTKTYL